VKGSDEKNKKKVEMDGIPLEKDDLVGLLSIRRFQPCRRKVQLVESEVNYPIGFAKKRSKKRYQIDCVEQYIP